MVLHSIPMVKPSSLRVPVLILRPYGPCGGTAAAERSSQRWLGPIVFGIVIRFAADQSDDVSTSSFQEHI